MFIPYSTDAPLYHFPAATLGLIVLNVALFFAVPGEYVRPESAGRFENGAVDLGPPDYPDKTLALQHGEGLKPWQWFTNSFVHNDPVALIFNMIFLWAFGLVVEGKVGHLMFLLLYAGIAVIHSALEQTLLGFWGSGASLGSAAAIYGILGIALVWAPQNEFEVSWFFGWMGAGTFSIPILMFAFIRFAFDFIGVAFTGVFGSDAIQLIGLALGISAGFVWLRRDWVDCEGWDLISVWQGKEGKREEAEDLTNEANTLIRESNQRLKDQQGKSKPKKSKKRTVVANQIVDTSAPEQSEAPTASKPPEEDLEELVIEGNVATAVKLFEKHKRSGTQLELKQAVLFEIIKGLLAEEKFEAALPCMEEHVKRFKHGQVALLLNMAKVYLHLELPRKAQRPLKSLQSLQMDEREKEQWKELAKSSKQQIADGAIEFSD